MKIGYARAAMYEQNLELQIEVLKKFECEVIFKENKPD